ncbi:hypothetical protein Psyaliredsea_20580 [Psychrobacter alimentarius]
MIAGLSKVGLTTDLRTVDNATIKHAEVKMQFKQAQQKISTVMSAGLDIPHAMKTFQDRINFEHNAFMQTVAEWQALKAQKIEMKKNGYSERLHEIDDKLKQEYMRVEKKFLSITVI